MKGGEVESIRNDLETRWERVHALLHDRGLPGLVIYGDASNVGNARYLTNYAPFFGPIVVIVPRDAPARMLITFDWEVERARLASGLDDIQAGYDIPGMARASLGELGFSPSEPFGLVGLNVIPHPVYMALTAGRAEPVDLGREFRDLRLIKSPLEQEMLRRAAAATDAALQTLPGRVKEGMTEIEVAATIDWEMRKAGAQGFAFPSGVGAGPNTERTVNVPSDRRLQPGDFVMVDIGAMYEGYQADLTRTFVVGEPSPRQREVHAAVRETLEGTLALAQPGTPMADLHRHAVRMLSERDLARYFNHRVGHGIGLETSLEPIDLRQDETELRPGMTFCVEPGVYIPGFGGVKIEDDVIVTEGDPEIISHTTHELLSL